MSYPAFIIPIIVGCVTQFTKFLLLAAKGKKLKLRNLFGPGHMPSAHTAFVVSLATTVFYFDGAFSASFAISVILAYIVIYDAVNIRTNIGYNAKIVNQLIKEIPNIEKEKYPTLREVVGHKPEEAFVGAIFGFVLSILLILILL